MAVSTSALDVDPNTPGLQVVRGTTIPVHVNVTDDVQVRDVELLVNDKVVRRDVTFPFDLSAVAFGVDQAATTVKIQARATDTGGNSTLIRSPGAGSVAGRRAALDSSAFHRQTA